MIQKPLQRQAATRHSICLPAAVCRASIQELRGRATTLQGTENTKFYDLPKGVIVDRGGQMPGTAENLQTAGQEMQKQEDSGSWEVMLPA